MTRRAAVNRLAEAALAFALAACASLQPPESVPATAATSDEAFDIGGRMSARRGDSGIAGAFTWTHDAHRDAIDLATPLGQTVARMRRDASGVRVERPNEAPVAYRDWTALMQAVLGAPIPVDGLAYWVQAVPDPGSASDVERDSAGRPLVLRQQGWEIVYAYNDASTRPMRLVMRYPGSEPVEVRIVVDAFEAQ